MRRVIVFSIVIGLLEAAAAAQASAAYQLNWLSINGGGSGNDNSHSYQLGLSVGESITGSAGSSSYRMGSGFWYGAAVVVQNPSSVPAAAPGVVRFGLGVPSPNPASGETAIAFSIAHEGNVSLSIYDVTGREVRNLVNGFHASGSQVVHWNGTDERGNRVAPGIYFYRLTMLGERAVSKVTIVR